MKRVPNKFFNTQELKVQGNQMLNMISDLYDDLDQVPVQPKLEPGFLRKQFEYNPPQKGIKMEEIMKETEEKIFPGITQWQHPRFFSYYPAGTSHPAVLADMFSTTFNSPAFMFNVSPSHTEVEYIVVDWIAQLFGLPEHFQLKNKGGGSMVISISDGLFNTVNAAKFQKREELGISLTDPRILNFVGYYTDHSFMACEKSLKIKDIAHIRIIPVKFDEKVGNFQPDLQKFKEMVKQDVENGLIPFWLNLTLGTTPSCAFDPIEDFAKVAKEHKIWINVDAAYAGVGWLLPELRDQAKGLELADSLLINCAKFMLTSMNGAVMFVKDKNNYQKAFSTSTNYIVSNELSDREDVIDYSEWNVGFGRRFNSLKLFYIIKSFGQEGLQEHISSKIVLAKYFENLVKKSKNFQILAKQAVTLVTFRYIGNFDKVKDIDKITKFNQQLKVILDEDTQKGYITPSTVDGVFFLRLVVCNVNTVQQDLDIFWEHLIQKSEQLEKEF